MISDKLKPLLLAEDDPNDVELAVAAMEDSNISNPIDVARDGVEVLDYLYCRGKFAQRSSGHPIAILLDLKMPRLNGHQVLEQIKTDDKLKSIPVVIMTSSREEKDLEKGYANGANAYVIKPIDFDQFTTSIQQLGLFWAVINEPPPN